MSYVLKNNFRQKSFFRSPLKIVSVIVVILAILYFFAPQLLSSVFIPMVRPFWNIEKNVRYGDSFVSVPDLVKENDSLKKTLAEKEALYVSLDLIKSENEELKKLLGRPESANNILAEILKKPPFSAYDTFILDTGSNDGIEKGNKVYALGGITIGEIAEVTNSTSKVLLYSSSGEKFDVLMGSSTIQAVAIGKGGGTFETTLPRDSKIKKGDRVIAPSLNNSFVGNVEDVIVESSQTFLTVLFRQPINIYEQRWVLVDRVPEIKKDENTKPKI